MALKFDENGLIPAIVQDSYTKQVLTLAYMNEESLAISLAERRCCFWSRSRRQLWRKDEDALLVQVSKEGPACHTGQESCFFNGLFVDEAVQSLGLSGLYGLLQGRQQQPQEGSYTSYLFAKGLDKILKKVGEEATEVIIAAKAEDRAETVYEVADLCYHVLVLLVQLGISPAEIVAELDRRHIIDHKVKQEKMG